MNERIRELAEQVGAVRNVLAMGRHDGVLFTEFELEKFAELIVRECSNLPFKSTGEVTTIGEIAVSNMILKHFGVE
jgi:hypothetical protein